MTADQDIQELLKTIETLERDNKSLRGFVSSASADALDRARKKNAELLAAYQQSQKALAFELLARKTPRDASGLSGTFAALKAEVLAYCIDRKVEPSLWKKLESL